VKDRAIWPEKIRRFSSFGAVSGQPISKRKRKPPREFFNRKCKQMDSWTNQPRRHTAEGCRFNAEACGLPRVYNMRTFRRRDIHKLRRGHRDRPRIVIVRSAGTTGAGH